MSELKPSQFELFMADAAYPAMGIQLHSGCVFLKTSEGEYRVRATKSMMRALKIIKEALEAEAIESLNQREDA